MFSSLIKKATLSGMPDMHVTPGSYTVTAKASDNLGGATISALVNIKVLANQLPAVSVTGTPGKATTPAVITLTAEATDTDSTIAKVEFFNGAALLATLTQPPYSYAWNQVPAGTYAITAKATDNQGSSTVSAVER